MLRTTGSKSTSAVIVLIEPVGTPTYPMRNKRRTTFFFVLEQPPRGGDTLFASQVEAYNRLSPEFQKRLEGLRALHPAMPQAEHSRSNGGPVRREPIETEHPVVRQHPVTGEKALYVNQGFTKKFMGFKVEESEYLVNFLFDHIAKGSDFQIRANYAPGLSWYGAIE